jgi:hypothetical protein
MLLLFLPVVSPFLFVSPLVGYSRLLFVLILLEIDAVGCEAELISRSAL